MKLRLYCGDKEELPAGYDAFGTRYTCLRKGYGAALHKDDPKDPNVLTDTEIYELAAHLHISLYNNSGTRRTKLQMIRLISAKLNAML